MNHSLLSDKLKCAYPDTRRDPQVVGALEFEFSRCMVHLQLLAASGSRVHIRVVVHPVVHACNRLSCMHDLNSEI